MAVTMETMPTRRKMSNKTKIIEPMEVNILEDRSAVSWKNGKKGQYDAIEAEK